MKICTKCKHGKLLTEFYRDKSRSDGVTFNCKDCIRIKRMDNRQDINKKRRAKGVQYRERKKEKIKTWKDRYQQSRGARVNAKYRKDNKEKIGSSNREYYKDNKEKILTQKREYFQKNKPKINAYIRNRYKTDPLFCAQCSARRVIKRAVKLGYKKDSSSEVAIGCSYKEFKLHIESQFTEGMSWANRSEWHIDHIKPMSKLLEDESHLMTHYSNLRPLWAADNLSKGSRIIASSNRSET